MSEQPTTTVADNQDTFRIEAFSDAVYAIAITLMVIELHAPEDAKEGELWHDLLHLWPQFASYLVSFAVIGIMWVNHHSMFKRICRFDRPLLYFNLLLLLWVALLPFPTTLVAQYLGDGGANASTATALYSLDLTLCAIAYTLLWSRAVRQDLLDPPIPASQQRAAIVRFSIGTVFYLACVGLSFLSPPLVMVLVFLLAGYYAFEQLRQRDG